MKAHGTEPAKERRWAKRMSHLLPFAEAVGGILLLTFFGLVFYGPSSLLSPHFHPFLVVILLVAGRYGFFHGLIAALLGTLDYYVLLLWQDQGVSLVPANFSFLWPSTFLFSGMVLGEIRDSERRRYDDLEERYLKEREAVRIAESDREILEKAKKDLERRIFVAPNVLSDLFDVLRSLEKEGEKEIPTTLVSLFTSFVGADSVALYRKERSGFVLELEGGQASVPKNVDPHYFPFSQAFDSLEKVTLKTHGLLPALDLPKGESVRPVGVYPILCEKERVELLLVVWHVPFEKLNPEFFQIAAMISERVSAHLMDLKIYKKAHLGAPVDEETGFLRPLFFARRAAEEIEKALRHQTNLTLLLVYFEGRPNEEMEYQHALTALRKAALPVFREADLSGVTDDRTGVAFCLPHTGERSTQIVQEKLLIRWKEETFDSPFLKNVGLEFRKKTFVPQGIEGSRSMQQHMMAILERMFVFDLFTGTWGEQGFADYFWGEVREREGTLGLLRLTFTRSSWEEALVIRDSLSRREDEVGKSLFSQNVQVGISLEGRRLWILLPEASEESLQKCWEAIGDIWKETDLPKLKKGGFSLEKQLLSKAHLDSSPMLSDLREISSQIKELQSEEVEPFGTLECLRNR